MVGGYIRDRLGVDSCHLRRQFSMVGGYIHDQFGVVSCDVVAVRLCSLLLKQCNSLTQAT